MEFVYISMEEEGTPAVNLKALCVFVILCGGGILCMCVGGCCVVCVYVLCMWWYMCFVCLYFFGSVHMCWVCMCVSGGCATEG